MKHLPIFIASAQLLLASSQLVRAHLIGDEAHEHTPPRYDFSVPPPTGILLRSHADFQRVILMAQAQPRTTAPAKGVAAPAPGASGRNGVVPGP